MELTGPWRAVAATEPMRRTFHDPDLAVDDWPEVTVPSHWSSDPQLEATERVLYRTSFEYPPPTDARRSWLTFDGVCQQGDIWLDGAYLGATDGYFVPHSFEVTDQLSLDRNHVLAADVSCGRFGDPDRRTSLTGALQDPELTGRSDIVPGGIWQAVRIHTTGAVAIRHWRAVVLDANDARARLSLRAVLDTPHAGRVVLRTRVDGTEHELGHSCAAGENRVEWTVDVPAPRLWWPHRLGDQPLSDLEVAALRDGEVHDSRHARIGFRSVRLRKWTFTCNGERLFLKGISALPTRLLLGEARPDEIRGDVAAARDAGLDLIRPTAHIARRELYEAADELGMLIWQDLPIRGLMSRSIGAQARRQAREAVDLLGHHPSIAIWCAHDEPFARPEVGTATPPVVGQQKPSWNRAVLDRSLKRILERTDGSRPVVAHTAVPPHLPTLDGTTGHLWFGWHGGRAADLAAAIARVPRMARFVSAFGAASVDPGSVGGRWPEIDWDDLASRCGADPRSLRRLVAPENCRRAGDWATGTRTAQAEVVRTTVELLRRVRFAPTGGFVLHTLVDPGPTGGFGILDHRRRPKPAWQALVDACRPVIVVADPLPGHMHASATTTVRVHVVSDLPEPLLDAVLTARVSADGVHHEHSWTGRIDADAVTFVGRIDVIAPDRAGLVTLDLELAADAVLATNRYETTVV